MSDTRTEPAADDQTRLDDDLYWLHMAIDMAYTGQPAYGPLMERLTRIERRLRAISEASDAHDYTQETVVQLTIRPPLDEPRWKALSTAAREAGAVHAHVNPSQPEASTE